MAFTTRRGRPPRAKPAACDYGTPETQFKRAMNLTQEPIDLCLDQGFITTRQHWCGLHLRWLYTLRYGAPCITTRYDEPSGQITDHEENPVWRMEREEEYRHAIALLQQSGRYEQVMRLCIFNEQPAFLDPVLKNRALQQPVLAERLRQRRQILMDGLNLLDSHWKAGIARQS